MTVSQNGPTSVIGDSQPQRKTTSSDQKKTEEVLDGNGDDPVPRYGRYDSDGHRS
jgi:hypothetical protein